MAHIICGFFALVLVAATYAQTTATELESSIEALISGFPGKVGVSARNISTGERAGVNEREPFYMASVYKVPIMIEVLRQVEEGKLSLSDRVTFTNEHRRDGSGLLRWMSEGISLSIEDLLHLMIAVSDNSATDMLLEKIGLENVNRTLRALGFKNISVDTTILGVRLNIYGQLDERLRKLSGGEYYSLVMSGDIFDAINRRLGLSAKKFSERDLPEAYARFYALKLNHATPEEMSLLFEKMARGEIISQRACQQMMSILGRQALRDRIPRYLPRDVAVAHKTGTQYRVAADAGIIDTGRAKIALSIFIKEYDATQAEADDLIGRIAKLVYDHFDSRGAPATPRSGS